ncbi:CTP synthase C-terminal region-related (seleno)protein [Streptomyces showdoensis]|uniref:CTP synthase (glutamine hydrolyzing) n=1 Tax=Streptomyces showdoensis TaxID=68268 RepID=A0A2P2GJA8_STREW|nr:CTP synthase [Streptomyces showdoensis]KKZ70915.1 CTP synthase [Streptomyces showdoensis]
MTPRPRLALVGDRSDRVPAHARFDEIVPAFGVDVDWLPSSTVTEDIAAYDGIWVVPGSPYVSQANVLLAIRTARTLGIPYLGTCGGFQHALIEYARNVLGLVDAEDVQYDADAATPLIVPLCCSLVGETAPLHFAPDTRLASVYPGLSETVETYHCKYGLNPEYEDRILAGSLRVTGWDAEKAPRAVELPDHPFFVGSLFQPELSSTAAQLHPLIRAFLGAVGERARHGH